MLNHVDQVCTLLLWDLKDAEDAAGPGAASSRLAEPAAPRRLRIFDLFLSERVLERLLDWSALCGPFEEQLRLEQLRIYEQLLRQCAPALLVQRAVLRPLTALLAGCRAAEQPVELHRRLVLVLAQLCAALHRQPPLLDLFLGLDEDGQPTSCSVFAMLVDFVHRDGVIGRTDREALLLCMRLSRENVQLAQYIVQHSNFCPVSCRRRLCSGDQSPTVSLKSPFYCSLLESKIFFETINHMQKVFMVLASARRILYRNFVV